MSLTVACQLRMARQLINFVASPLRQRPSDGASVADPREPPAPQGLLTLGACRRPECRYLPTFQSQQHL